MSRGALTLRSSYAPEIGIVALAVVVAITRADAWMSGLSGIPFGSVVWMTMVASFVVALTYGTRVLALPNASFAALAAFYVLAFATCTLFTDTTYAGGWLRDALYAFLTFAVVYCFTTDEKRLRSLARWIVVCGVVVSLVNLVEILRPTAVHLSHSQGRAAGLLKNANTSAFVITACFIVHQIGRRAWAEPGTIVSIGVRVVLIAGVLATMSRGGMITLAGAIATETLAGGSRRDRGVSLVAVAVVVVLAQVALRSLFRSGDPGVFYSLQKISGFLHGQIDDNYRLVLARYYLERSLDHPWLGYGFSATTAPSAANTDMLSFFGVKGPHNTPVAILVEFGVVPLVAWIAFFAASCRAIARIDRRDIRIHLFVLLGAVALQNVFSHDMPLSRPAMVFLAFLAAAPAHFHRQDSAQDPPNAIR